MNSILWGLPYTELKFACSHEIVSAVFEHCTMA